jgi:hypothetical protein
MKLHCQTPVAPAAQILQLVAFHSGWNKPGSHFVQMALPFASAEAPLTENRPGSHFVHFVL